MWKNIHLYIKRKYSISKRTFFNLITSLNIHQIFKISNIMGILQAFICLNYLLILIWHVYWNLLYFFLKKNIIRDKVQQRLKVKTMGGYIISLVTQIVFFFFIPTLYVIKLFLLWINVQLSLFLAYKWTNIGQLRPANAVYSVNI